MDPDLDSGLIYIQDQDQGQGPVIQDPDQDSQFHTVNSVNELPLTSRLCLSNSVVIDGSKLRIAAEQLL